MSCICFQVLSRSVAGIEMGLGTVLRHFVSVSLCCGQNQNVYFPKPTGHDHGGPPIQTESFLVFITDYFRVVL